MQTDKPKILLVDSDENSCILFQESVSEIYENIEIIKNGQRALDKCKNDKTIKLVLTELNLPDLDGFQLLTELRKMQPDIKIILQTSVVTKDIIEKCCHVGFDEFISKPIDYENLIETIRKYI
jgi:CheY-like chemotaxis protein